MTRWKKWTGRTAALALGLAVAAAAWGLKVEQRDILAQKSFPHPVVPLEWATKLETFTHSDGFVSHGARRNHPNALATVLYFGGNGYTIDRFGERVTSSWGGLPVNLVVYDRRGYGRSSEGEFGLARWSQDALELYQHTMSEETLPVVVHGHSLGSFVASELIARVNPPWVVLEAPGTRVADFVREHLPFGIRHAIRLDMDAELAKLDVPAWVRAATGQVLVLKSEADSVLPGWMADVVAQALPEQHGHLVTCEGANHHNMGMTGCFKQAYAPWIERWQEERGAGVVRMTGGASESGSLGLVAAGLR
jgi:pimeloyl-ACP methyl ester carboxylesterase